MRSRAPSKRGFVVVDVVTALAMLAATLGLTLTALTTALRVEQAAAERRAAQGLLQDLAERPFQALGPQTGRSGRFSWRAELRPVASLRPGVNCSLRLTVSAADGDYSLATVRACPPPEDREAAR